MKKFLFGIGLVVALVFTGCVSPKMAYVFDSGISEDQMSFLWVPNYVKVTQFDGTSVECAGSGLTPAKVGVPSGEHTFVFDVAEVKAAGLPVSSGKSFTENFATGKGYQLINRNGEIVFLALD